MARLKKRSDGRYQKSVYVGQHPDTGKPQYKIVYGKTVTEVEENTAVLKLQMRRGIDIIAASDTFGQWMERWLKLKAADVGRSTYMEYLALSKRVEPIADYPISKIRQAQVQDLLNLAAASPPPAKKTLSITKSLIKQAFDFAIENRVMEYNPAVSVKIPKGLPPRSGAGH